MPIKIVRRGSKPNTNYDPTGILGSLVHEITETHEEYAERVSKLIDEDNWSIVQVLAEREAGYLLQPVFILKQKVSQGDIISVKTVDNNEVDPWLTQGYVVEQINAKTTNLVKRAEVKKQ